MIKGITQITQFLRKKLSTYSIDESLKELNEYGNINSLFEKRLEKGNAQVNSGLKLYTGFLKTNGSLAVCYAQNTCYQSLIIIQSL